MYAGDHTLVIILVREKIDRSVGRQRKGMGTWLRQQKIYVHPRTFFRCPKTCTMCAQKGGTFRANFNGKPSWMGEPCEQAQNQH